MKTNRLPLSIRSLGVLLAVSLFIIGCTRGDPAATSLPSSSASAIINGFNSDDRTQYSYLYVVHCNGTVERLDLVQREKAGSFQLSERSGNPSAVAALPIPTMRPWTCLARPVVTGDMQDQAAGVVHLVVSGDKGFDSHGRGNFSVLTFALPDWTLQHVRALGNFFHSEIPRLVRVTAGEVDPQSPQFVHSPDGTIWRILPGQNFIYETNLIQTYGGKERLSLERGHLAAQKIIEWSAERVLFRYELSGQDGSDLGGFGFALADHRRRQIMPLDEFLEEDFPIPPDAYLAPGGQFVLMVMSRVVPLGEGIEQVENSGELRLYDAEGRLVSTLIEPSIEGEKLAQVGKVEHDELVMSSANIWRLIALTPNGLAVFTNLRGDYRFIELGQTFGVEPVVNPNTGEPRGTYPGLVYARE